MSRLISLGRVSAETRTVMDYVKKDSSGVAPTGVCKNYNGLGLDVVIYDFGQEQPTSTRCPGGVEWL